MMICPHCGKETAGIAYCECCGAQIPNEARPVHKKNSQKKETIIAVGIGICIGAVVILGAFVISRAPLLFYSNTDNSIQVTSETESQDSPKEDGVIDSEAEKAVETEASNDDKAQENVVSSEEMVAHYEEIFQEYSDKLTELTPVLVEEFNAEAEANEGGIEGLTEIFDAKIDRLSEIYIKGTEAMTNYMYEVKSDDSGLYLEWTQKLSGVFMEESQKITDEYTQTPYGK